jgi:hypothetical protein
MKIAATVGPQSTSKIANKNETGAIRAIYTVNLVHYLISSYVLFSFENEDGIEGTTLNCKPGQLSQWYDRIVDMFTVNRCENNFFCADYAGFNEQHSIKDMKIVFSHMKTKMA